MLRRLAITRAVHLPQTLSPQAEISNWSLSTRAFELPLPHVLSQAPLPRRRPWAFRLGCRFDPSEMVFQLSCCFLAVLCGSARPVLLKGHAAFPPLR